MLKRVAVVDDICSFGKCSLGVALPILSASNCEVYPAITAVFSAHTPIENFTKISTKEIFQDSIKNWKNQGVKFDAIYTGALSDKAQAYTCLDLLTDHQKYLKVVDPVLGDFGHFYDKNFKALLPHIILLCGKADIITPNITEAQLLTGSKEKDPNKLLIELKNLGAKNIILKGVVEDDTIHNYLLNEDNSIHVSSGKYYDELIHGAGDVFGSSIIAAILNNRSLNDAIDFATEVTSEAVALTIKETGFQDKGILFEPVIERYTNL